MSMHFVQKTATQRQFRTAQAYTYFITEDTYNQNNEIIIWNITNRNQAWSVSDAINILQHTLDL
jgi:hypothetical protein